MLCVFLPLHTWSSSNAKKKTKKKTCAALEIDTIWLYKSVSNWFPQPAAFFPEMNEKKNTLRSKIYFDMHVFTSPWVQEIEICFKDGVCYKLCMTCIGWNCFGSDEWISYLVYWGHSKNWLSHIFMLSVPIH